MIYERIHLIHRLLADEGNLYLHCGIQVNNILRTVLDEVFGAENFVTEIMGWEQRIWTENVLFGPWGPLS